MRWYRPGGNGASERVFDHEKVWKRPCSFGRERSYKRGHALGARPTAVTARERVQRDSRIVESRARGQTWSATAAANGVSERHCRRIADQYRDTSPSLQEWDPIAVVEQAYERYESAYERLAEITEEAKNDSARVGAVRAQTAVIGEQLALLQAVGVLPSNLGKLAVQADARTLAAHVVAIFDKYDLPVEAEEELRSLIA